MFDAVTQFTTADCIVGMFDFIEGDAIAFITDSVDGELKAGLCRQVNQLPQLFFAGEPPFISFPPPLSPITKLPSPPL